MDLSSASYSLGAVSGFRKGTKDAKQERQADEDREHTLDRRAKDDTYVDTQRATQQQAAKATTENAQLKLDETRARIDDERALDFLYEIDAGVDPRAAAERHNSYGSSRMNVDTVNYDSEAQTVRFKMDTDGDGVEDEFEYNVPKTMEVMERITGKNPKDRYMPMADGAYVFDRVTKKIVAQNPKDPTSASARPGRHTVYGVGLVDDNGKVITPEGRRKTGGGAHRNTTMFNPQTYTKDITNSLGKMLGGKYDPTTEQFEFAGGTGKMVALSRIAQRQGQRMLKHGGAISSDMVASVVANLAQDFDEKTIRNVAKAKIEEDAGTSQRESAVFGLGKVKPQVMKDKQDEAVQNALAVLEAQVQTALDAEVLRAADPGFTTADVEDTIAAEEAADGEGPEDPTATAADQVPARAPKAAIDFLKKNPHLKAKFKAKYGYLPGDE